MKTRSFRVAGLPSCYHTSETKKAFDKHLNGELTATQFITLAIVKYAQSFGFTYNGDDYHQPSYVSDERFAEIRDAIDKSRKKDYTYLVAFEYLLNQHPGASKSFIQRQAVLNFC